LRAPVSIEQIADSLRIKPDIIAAFEANDLSEWPKGLYSRAWIRTYALAVDLDPVDTVDEFCGCFRRATGVQAAPSRRSPPSWRRRRNTATSSDTRGPTCERPERGRSEGGLARVPHAAKPCAVDAADARRA
jgi:hypothetical protein